MLSVQRFYFERQMLSFVWDVSVGSDPLGLTDVASVRTNSATFPLWFGILTHVCGRPTRAVMETQTAGLNGCRLAPVAMARLPRRCKLAHHVPLSLHNCRNDASKWSYLLAMERSLSFLPSREARCCSRASRRELGALGGGKWV